MTNVELKAYALKSYDYRGIFNQSEFDKHFSNLMTSKKMVGRFVRDGVINEKLLINNIIRALNNFGSNATTVVFRNICDDVYFGVIKSIMIFLCAYDYSVDDTTKTNRIIDDILFDTAVRYNLSHLET